MATTQQAMKVKKVSAEKKPKSHPTYAEMIKEAITALKERSGSSQIAIAKFMEEKHNIQNLAPNYKKLLLSQLKKLVASGSLVKVKHSFKLAAAPKKAAAPKPKKAETTKPKKAESKPKKAETKPKKAAALKAKKAAKTSTPVKAKKATPKKKAATPAAMKAKKVVMKAKAGAKKPKSIKSPVKKAEKKAKK